MLSVAVMSGGQGQYYSTIAREDYYVAGGEPPGIWLGRGAEQLGLDGTVKPEDFLQLFDGFLDGQALVQNAGKENHRPGWDLTFSAPKSVSVVWSQADLETALEIQAAQRTAVEKAVLYIEQEACWTRRGKGGHDHQRCDVVVAAFEHGTSRAMDPQLHTHALLLNVAARPDGSTGTLETQALYEHKMAAGAIYRAELAYQLERRLGLTIERVRSWFEIAGVPKALVEEFSKRRHDIEASLREKGFSSSKAAEIAALDTRSVKEHIPRADLIKSWRAVGKENQWGEDLHPNLIRGPQPEMDCEADLSRAAARVTDQLLERHSFFAARELTRFLAEEAQSMRAGADAVLDAAKEHLAHGAGIVRLGLRFREPIFTTKAMLALEEDLMERVRHSGSNIWAGASETIVRWAIDKRVTMNDEQKQALRHVTCEGGTISTVTGMAGTGKTFMLDAARSVFELSGYQVIGAALAGKAARGLQEGTGIESATISRLLRDLDRGDRTLDAKTVLVVDEAGMVGTVQMHRLVTKTEEAGAKLILVGDEKQLQPIDAGGPFAALAKELGTAALTKIVRQREAWQRQTVLDLAAGYSQIALAEYANRGFVSVLEDRDQARAALLAAWAKDGLQHPQENLILTGSNLDAVLLNRTIQELRAKEGFVKKDSVCVSGEDIHEGDRVLFTRNSAALGVNNGTLASVTFVNKTLSRLTVRLDNGEERTFSTYSYDYLKLGYAFTTHKAQGVTAENVFVLTSETMQGRELSYVQASRPRGEAHFFTTESEAGEMLSVLSRTMAKSHLKNLAIHAATEPSPSLHSPLLTEDRFHEVEQEMGP